MPLHVFFPCFGTKTVPFLVRESCIRHGVTLVYTSSMRQAKWKSMVLLFWMNKNAFYRCRRRELTWNGWGGKKRKKTQNQLFNWWVNRCSYTSLWSGFFVGRDGRLGLGVKRWLTKKQVGGWAGGRDRQMDLFFTVLSLPFLHFTTKKCEITIGLKELQCTCLQQASK